MEITYIRAVFGALKTTTTKTLFQIDSGVILQVAGIADLPEYFQADFSTSEKGTATRILGHDGEAIIPDQLLKTGLPIWCWIYVTNEITGRTVYTVKIPVKQRSIVEGIEPTPEQADIITQAINALNSAGDSAQQSASEAQTYAERAETASESAETSETNASQSAVESQGYAENASQSATDAAQSAQSASSSAQGAFQAATSANTAMNNSHTAESNAKSAESGAQGYAQSAQASAESAQGFAQDAQASAESASASAATASEAKETAVAKADEASGYAQTATDKSGEAQQARQGAEEAQALAETAQGKAEEAQTAAETAQTKAEEAAERADVKQDGTYDNMTAGSAKQLISSKYTVEAEPYMFRASGGQGADREYDEIVGGSIVWNQLVSGSATSVTVPNGHKYVSKISGVYSVGASTGTAISVTGGTDEIFDITQMFGSTIADHIYSLEQTAAGAGVAFFRKLFPKDYYEYNAGELMHVSGVSAHKMRDADENVIATYPLDSSLTLKGVPKIADGKLYYSGDHYKADGTVERWYGIVDLGTLDWSYNIASQGAFTSYTIRTQIASNDIVCTTAYEHIYNFTSNKLASKDKAIGINITVPGTAPTGNFLPGAIVIKDSSYTDAESFKAAMSGVYLVYELATPTTETADPYQSLQITDPYGTEEYVTTGIVPVGHETKYPENLRAKIEGLPWDFSSLIAPTENGTASRNYTVGSLLIMDNVLYKVTANIANGGTITPNTNVTATTLSEVISALA